MNDIPKLQWSKFSPDRSEQYVIREDNEEIFDRLVAKYKAILPKEEAFPNDSGSIATPPEKVQAGLGSCPKCGAPNTKYSTGRIGCSKFCWKK